MSEVEFSEGEFKEKANEEILELIHHHSFQIRQHAQREAFRRGNQIIIQLREALSDCVDSEKAHRLQNLIVEIQREVDQREKTRRLKNEKESLAKKSEQIQETLELWENRLIRLQPLGEDCRDFLAHWSDIKNYLFWLRERLNEIEIRRATLHQAERSQP
jgi:chromosome condensin MukBEF ATPase and DNA-binding subunit MukB